MKDENSEDDGKHFDMYHFFSRKDVILAAIVIIVLLLLALSTMFAPMHG